MGGSRETARGVRSPVYLKGDQNNRCRGCEGRVPASEVAVEGAGVWGNLVVGVHRPCDACLTLGRRAEQAVGSGSIWCLGSQDRSECWGR